MKKRIISILAAVCIAVIAIFGGATPAKAASRFPESNGGTVNGHSYPNWTIAPGNTGEQMYSKIESEIINKENIHSDLRNYTFISKDMPASAALFDEYDAYFWHSECKAQDFTEGTYYIYVFK